MKTKISLDSGVKYAPPKLGVVLERQRLSQDLWSKRSASAVWLAAPAGYGKTTTMACFIKEYDLTHLWFQFDYSDDENEAYTFLTNLADALSLSFPDITPPTTSPGYLDDIQNYALNYFKVVMAEIPENSILVFDDFHLISPDSAISEMIDLALSLLPEHCQIYLLSRNYPSSKYTPGIAAGSMAVLSYEDFKLSKNESIDLVKLKGIYQEDENIIDDILLRTEGWISGFVLRILSSSSLTNVETTEGMINDQFRVISKKTLAPEAYLFLLKSSVFPKMTESMVRELTDNTDSTEILESLCYNNRFTYKSNDAPVVYQYHALFREFLVSEAKTTFPVEVQIENQKKAARILEINGDIQSAADMLIELHDWNELHQLLVNHAQSLLNVGQFKPVLAWIDKLPEEVFSNSSHANYFKAVCTCPTNPSKAISYFQDAYDLIAKNKSSPHHIAIVCEIIEAVRLQQTDFLQMVSWKALLINMLGEQPELPQALKVRVQTAIYSALLLADASKAELIFWDQKVVESLRLPMTPILKISMSMLHIGYVVCLLGDRQQSQRVIEDSESYLTDKPPSFVELAGWHAYTASYHYWFTSDKEKGIQYIEKGLQVSRNCGAHLYNGLLYFFGLMITFSENDTKTTEIYLSEFNKHIRSHDSFDYALFLFVDAMQNWHQGRFDEALKKAFQSLEKTKKCYHPGFYPYMHFAVARTAASAGDMKLALYHVGKVRCISRKMGSHNLAFVSRLLCADFALQRGKISRASLLLEDALRNGREQGFANLPWFTHRQLAELFLLALDHGIEVEYVCKWIAVKQIEPPLAKNRSLKNWPWKVKVYALKEIQVFVDQEPLAFSGKTPKTQLQMLKLLAVAGFNGVSDHVLADILWPDAEGDSAYNSLKTTIWRLRKLIGLEEAILFGNHRISLNPKICWVDVWELQSLR